MTSPALATSTPDRRRGFTLIEILVVIGLLVVLIAITAPLVVRAQRQAVKSRVLADMQSIASALEAYKADFGDYPRVTVANTGAAVLGKALLALGPGSDPVPAFANATPYTVGQMVQSGGIYYECIAASTGNPVTDTSYWATVAAPTTPAAVAYNAALTYKAGETVSDTGVAYVCIRYQLSGAPTPVVTNAAWWAPFSTGDGANGPGFRIRAGSAAKRPYLQADRFKVVGTDLVDNEGNPILYFPASPAKRNLSAGTGHTANLAAASSDATSLYDPNDNVVPFRLQSPTVEATDVNAMIRIRAMLGDMDADGQIDSAVIGTKRELTATEAPFLLWAAGRDGIFGPPVVEATVTTDALFNSQAKKAESCDDVVNFR